MRRRPSSSERLALSLGFTIKHGKKHGKVFDSDGRMIAVYPLTGGRDDGMQLANYRAALLRHAKKGPQ